MANEFIFTDDQQKSVCEYYGEDITQLNFNDICELLDRLIDETIYGK